MATGYAVTTLAQLKAIPAADREDRLALRVADERSWYQWRDGVTDGIIPDDNPATGRWIKDIFGIRRDIVLTTASLANNAHEQTTFIARPGLIVYQIQTDKPARIRIYSNTTKQAADVNRTISSDLQTNINFDTGGAGLLVEEVTSAGDLIRLRSPMTIVATIPSSNNIPITITNLSGSAGTIQTTLTIMEIE